MKRKGMVHVCLILISVFVANETVSQVLTGSLAQNVVVIYSFDGNANDLSGGGYHGNIFGATITADRFGRSSSAFYFNGSGAYIRGGKILPDSSSFTISAWIRPDSLKTAGIFYDSAYFTPGRDTTFHMFADGKMETQFSKISDPGPPYLVTPQVLVAGSWAHVVATSSATSTTIFINGSVVASQNTGSHNIGYHSDFYIGAENHGFNPESFFHGAIDDVLFYDRMLSEPEVALLFQIQSIPEPSSLSLLLAGGAVVMAGRRRK
jgi:hypothetical protein